MVYHVGGNKTIEEKDNTCGNNSNGIIHSLVQRLGNSCFDSKL